MLVFFTACDQSKTQVKASRNDSAVIMKLAVDEALDFYSKDFSKWASHYVQDEQVHWVCIEPSVTLKANGWKDLSTFVGQWMKDNPAPISNTELQISCEDIHLRISDSMAQASWQQLTVVRSDTPRKTMEYRTFIHKTDSWKISSMASYPSKENKNMFDHLKSKDTLKVLQ
jgi:hypothetical protein